MIRPFDKYSPKTICQGEVASPIPVWGEIKWHILRLFLFRANHCFWHFVALSSPWPSMPSMTLGGMHAADAEDNISAEIEFDKIDWSDHRTHRSPHHPHHPPMSSNWSIKAASWPSDWRPYLWHLTTPTPLVSERPGDLVTRVTRHG